MKGGEELVSPLRGLTVLISPALISRVVRELCPPLCVWFISSMSKCPSWVTNTDPSSDICGNAPHLTLSAIERSIDSNLTTAMTLEYEVDCPVADIKFLPLVRLV